jgi:hypothetical protein
MFCVLLSRGTLPRVEEMSNAYRILAGKSEGKRPLGRPSHRWEDNIEMSLVRVWIAFNWLRVKLTTVAGSYTHGNEPSVSIKSGNYLIS